MTAPTSERRRRKYDAPTRRARAADTRSHVLQAALQLLSDKGYVGTTIEAIAAQAGVGVRTVYDAFGSKQGVLLDLVETFSPMPRTDFEALAEAGAADPPAQLRLIVNFIVEYFAAAERFLEILNANADADPVIAEVLHRGETLRRASQREILHSWLTRGVLKHELSARRAGDILWALTGPDLFRLFVRQLGWTKQSYARWLHDAVGQLLFAPP